MTFVAMALAVENEHSLVVAVCDALLSSGTYSVNMPFGTKVLPLHNPGESGWLIAYAGDGGHFQTLRDIISRSAKPDINAEATSELARLAYEIYRRQLIEAEVLGGYNIKMKTYLAEGRERFGDREFRRINKRIEQFDVGITLLLGGFAPGGSATSGTRLTCISNPGVACHDFLYGVTAIGEGARPALEYLYSTHSRFDPLGITMCRVLEAKFIAEATTRSVGSDTSLIVLGPNNLILGVSNEQCNAFRTLWNQRRKQFPEDMMELLRPSEVKWL